MQITLSVGDLDKRIVQKHVAQSGPQGIELSVGVAQSLLSYLCLMHLRSVSCEAAFLYNIFVF